MALSRLVEAVGDAGHEVTHAPSPADGLILAGSHPHYGAVCFVWDLDGRTFPAEKATRIVGKIRERDRTIPIMAIVASTTVSDLPLAVSREVSEYVYLTSDTPHFIAERIGFAVRRYEGRLLPPYFGTMKRLSDDGLYYWDCPGHMGGIAYTKHPVGARFLEFFGENMMRADIGVATGEMGDYLEQDGPPLTSEKRAAKAFGADWTFYTVGGSSASNRIVGQGAVGYGEIAVADRNCHKSMGQALTLARAYPVYLRPSHNGYGMVGIIPPDRLEADAVRQLIADSPITGDAVSQDPTYAVVTNCTYDGLCYRADKVVDQLGPQVPRIHFDEAWFAYAKFHPLYENRFAMGVESDGKTSPTIFAVQSTHKMLPALSSASMIHVKRSERAPLEFDDFNDAVMMHGTTSPFYPILASIDVGTTMMEGDSGYSLMQEAIEDAIGFRKAVVSLKRQIEEADGEDAWFFDVFQPAEVADPDSGESYSFEEAPVELLSSDQACWSLNPGDSWHGFEDRDVDGAHSMLDPVKVTVICPGVDPDGTTLDWGVPGYVVAKFLDARRTEIARTGDYTLLILFSVGTAKGKWGSFLEALLDFKRLYDEGAMAIDAIPSLAEHAEIYGEMTLKELCTAMHEGMAEAKITERLAAANNFVPEPVITPAECFGEVVRYKAERIKVSDLPGRIAAAMLVPYPPGIPMLMPGERLPQGHGPIVEYFVTLQEFDKKFPGFEHEIHGVRTDEEGNFWVRALVEDDREPDRPKLKTKKTGSSAVKKGRQ